MRSRVGVPAPSGEPAAEAEIVKRRTLGRARVGTAGLTSLEVTLARRYLTFDVFLFCRHAPPPVLFAVGGPSPIVQLCLITGARVLAVLIRLRHSLCGIALANGGASRR